MKKINTWFEDINWKEIFTWDILKWDVIINKDIHWDYFYCLVKEDKDDEYMSWFYVDKQLSTSDLDYVKNPEIVWNLEKYPNFWTTFNNYQIK